MSTHECQLVVKNLPRNVSANRLKVIFQNSKRQGGGPIKDVQLFEESSEAIVTFEEREAVEVVLRRGNVVDIQGTSCNICPVVPSKPTSYRAPNMSPPSPKTLANGPSTSTQSSRRESHQDQTDVMSSDKTVQINYNDETNNIRQDLGLFLKDSDINTGRYLEDCVFVDGLKKMVYVTFENREDAQKLCKYNCSDEVAIEKIEMADGDFYDHYIHLLSIHGRTVSDEQLVKNFVKEKTGVYPTKVIVGEEPLSAILVFKKEDVRTKSQLYGIAAKLDDAGLVTAPVRHCKNILATVPRQEYENNIKRYFKNNWGPIESLQKKDDCSYIVTFKNAKDAESVGDKTNLGTMKLTTKLWHCCLSEKAYKNYRDSCVGDANASACDSWPGIEDSECINGTTEKVEMELHEYALLLRSDCIGSVQKERKSVKIESDDETHTVTIRGPVKMVQHAKNDIDEMLSKFEEEFLKKFENDKFDFIAQSSVLEMINDILKSEKRLAYVYTKSDRIYCYKHGKNKKSESILNLIERRLVRESKPYDQNMMMTLNSDSGRQFLSDLQQKSDVPCKIVLENNKLTLYTFEKDPSKKIGMLLLQDDIRSFFKENSIHKKSVPFVDLHVEYARKFMGFDKSLVPKLKDYGVEVTVEYDSITITGIQTAIDQAVDEIEMLRKRITIQEVHIPGFGIKEYLLESGEMLDSLGRETNCLIKIRDDTSLSGQAGTTGAILVGSCTVNKMKVQFFNGDITSLKVNVIINPIDSKRQLKSGMNKVIAKKGGDSIQRELDNYQRSTRAGTVIETPGGKLQCAAIYHLLLEKDEDPKVLFSYVDECLKKAEQDGHKSVAMPLLGLGRFRMQEVGASLNIAKALKQYAGQTGCFIDEVFFCDADGGNVKSIMDRFDLDYESASLDHVAEKKDSQAQKAPGMIIKEGNILEEKCDVIVCGLKNSMQLSGGTVSKSLLKMCGDSLQTECDQKADEFSQEGAIVASSNGLSCQAVIFVNMDKFKHTWYKGVLKALSLAESKGFTSIAMPALGTGRKHADIPKLKSAILNAVEDFEKKRPKNLTDVRLVIYEKRILYIFRDDDVYDKKYKRRGATTASRAGSCSKSAQLSVVFQNASDGDKAVKKVKDNWSQQFKKTIYTDEEIKYLTDKEMKEFTNGGLEQQVEVNIDRQTGTATFGSFRVDAIYKVKDAISECIHLKTLKVAASYKWQFLRKDNRWSDFEIKSACSIEKAFKDEKDSAFFEDPKGRKYRIDFKTMKEFEIMGNGTEKERATVNRFNKEAGVGKVPSHWDKMGDENLKIVTLSNTSQEYKNVEKYFQSCGAQNPIKQIDRIQNVVLYQQYEAKKAHFEKRNPKGHENEKQLFHGTDPAAVANINESGFNRSFCGKNATAYGKGVYFAERSQYSVGYAQADANGDKRMYVAKVLVGISTASNSSMNYLPNQPAKNYPFDSGTGPSMFIIFHDCQAYPEYLITFT